MKFFYEYAYKTTPFSKAVLWPEWHIEGVLVFWALCPAYKCKVWADWSHVWGQDLAAACFWWHNLASSLKEGWGSFSVLAFGVGSIWDPVDLKNRFLNPTAPFTQHFFFKSVHCFRTLQEFCLLKWFKSWQSWNSEKRIQIMTFSYSPKRYESVF